MTQKQKSRLSEIVARLAENLNPSQWADIGQLRERVRVQNLIDLNDPQTVEELCDFAAGELIRRAMRRKGDDGYPLFPSISVPSKDGNKKVRRYMSERKMKHVHYNEFGSECHGKAVYWMRMENATMRRDHQRYGNGGQLDLPWPEAG